METNASGTGGALSSDGKADCGVGSRANQASDPLGYEIELRWFSRWKNDKHTALSSIARLLPNA